MATELESTSVLQRSERGWYVKIRCEGLKPYRFGPFPNRAVAQRFHADALRAVEDFLIMDAALSLELDRFVPCRKVGRVCSMGS